MAVGALAAIIVIFLALQTPLLNRARGLAWHSWITLVTRLWPVGALEVDNDTMEQLQRLTSENVLLKAELADYQRLKEQIGSPAMASYRAIPAEASARPLDAFGVSFIINRGVKDGITLHAPVVIYSSTLIGFISELGERTATVQLLLHPSTNLTVEALGETSPRGLLVSRHYTSLVMTTIPRDAHITAGQDVVTSASDTVPTGLRVGTVGVSRSEENQAYQEASLVLPYDPDQIRAVTIIVAP